MLPLTIHLDGDNCWSDLKDKLDDVIHVTSDNMEIAALKGGMASGKPSVCIRINLPDGQVVIAETSMMLFLLAASSFLEKYNDDIQADMQTATNGLIERMMH